MFHNQNVVITGAGRGIGRALAMGFAAQGAIVLVHYAHAQKEAQDVVSQVESEGGRALLERTDLTVTNEVAQLVNYAKSALGPIDVWIKNAGASANSSEAPGLSEEERFERMMAVDVMGTWRCCHAVAPHMRDGSCIFTTGWDHALDGTPGFINLLYATSKGAVIAMTRCLAQELAPRVRVNCIAPGWIETA